MVLVLIILGILLQASFITIEHRGKLVAAVVLKGLASLCFVLIGFLCTPGDHFSDLVVTGLIFGMAGDILLSLRYVFTKIGQKIFLIGILVFLIGHVFYLIALFHRANGSIIPAIIGLVIAALLLAWIFQKITVKKAFKIFGIFYIGAVTLMAIYAVWNALQAPGAQNLMFAFGGVLFLASDVVLIFNTFTGTTRFPLRITNLGLYYIGQLLIAISLMMA